MPDCLLLCIEYSSIAVKTTNCLKDISQLRNLAAAYSEKLENLLGDSMITLQCYKPDKDRKRV